MYELSVLFHVDGTKEKATYNTEEEAEKAAKGFYMAFGYYNVTCYIYKRPEKPHTTKDDIIRALNNWHTFYGSLQHEVKRFSDINNRWYIAELWERLADKYNCQDEIENIGY